MAEWIYLLIIPLILLLDGFRFRHLEHQLERKCFDLLNLHERHLEHHEKFVQYKEIDQYVTSAVGKQDVDGV